MKEIWLEIIRIIVTFVFGFFTFRIYQFYRNKKDNSLLYVKLKKLEREMLQKINTLDKVINLHIKHKEYGLFLLSKETDNLKVIFDLVFNIYVNHSHMICFHGEEPFETYEEYPYEKVEELELEKNSRSSRAHYDQRKIDEIDQKIDQLMKISIYDLFLEIRNVSSISRIGSSYLNQAIKYLINSIDEFLANDSIVRKKKLEEFCNNLFDGENCFAFAFKEYIEFRNIGYKISKSNNYENIVIEFSVWFKQEMEFLCVFNSEDYLFLETFYDELRRNEIYEWELEKANTLKDKFLNAYNERIQKNVCILESTLKSTNRWFWKL